MHFHSHRSHTVLKYIGHEQNGNVTGGSGWGGEGVRTGNRLWHTAPLARGHTEVGHKRPVERQAAVPELVHHEAAVGDAMGGEALAVGLRHHGPGGAAEGPLLVGGGVAGVHAHPRAVARPQVQAATIGLWRGPWGRRQA